MMVAPESKQTSDNSKSLEEGLDFILRHFEEPIWPRTISTNVTGGRQILTYNKPQALARFKQANLLDCRINAYPDYTGFGGLNRQGPNFIFIDLDRSNFKTEKSYKLALEATLQNIKEKLSESNPTVLWSGNGYHIYQPTKAFPLEQVDKFSRSGGNKFDQQQLQPSIAFLRFAEQYLSNNKSDPLHNPSFKSCMIRIPGSYNSKCEGCSSSEVKIIQMWNGYRPKINLLLGSLSCISSRSKPQ